MIIATTIEAKYNPAQIESPRAAVTHIFAAVVSHFVSIPIFIIAHAPRNHTPDTTCAAILPGSLMLELYISGTMIERIINKHDPTQMSMCVLIPAGCLLSSLSSHNTKAMTSVRNKRSNISDCEITSIIFLNNSILL